MKLCEQMPTRWEQDVAETYVNEHTLNRPKNIIKNVVLFSLVFFAVTGALRGLFALWSTKLAFLCYCRNQCVNSQLNTPFCPSFSPI